MEGKEKIPEYNDKNERYKWLELSSLIEQNIIALKKFQCQNETVEYITGSVCAHSQVTKALWFIF